jgi:hypothetical protein
LGEELTRVFDHLWESPAPSKVIAFSWQLLYDRIPSRSNLLLRGIEVSDKPWECVGCVGKVESSIHLFLHCPGAKKIWSEIFNWLGVSIVIPLRCRLSLKFLEGLLEIKGSGKVMRWFDMQFYGQFGRQETMQFSRPGFFCLIRLWMTLKC